MKNIYLLRHTPVKPGLTVCYGNTDVALAESAEEDIAKVVAQYQSFDGTIISSPLTRCKLLAKRISETCGQDVQFFDELKEIDFGDWEMKPWKDILKKDLEAWANQLDLVAPPNGECFKDVQTRAVNVLKTILSENPQAKGDLLVVTHGGVIRTLLAHCLNLKVNQAVQFNVVHGSTAHLVRGIQPDGADFYQLKI